MATIKPRGRSWYINYTDPATGKQIRRSLGAITKKEAERVKRRVEQQTSPAASILAPATAPTVSDFADTYLAWHESEYPASTSRIEIVFDLYIEPSFGHVPLDALDPFEIEQWKIRRLADGAKRATVNKELQSFKAMLNRAVDWKVIKENPIAGVKALKINDSKPPRFYSADEMQRIYAAAPHHHAQWRLMANAGLRRTEALQIETRHIKSDRIEVWSSEDSRTKSGKWRDVPINENAAAAIKELRAQTDGPRLFPQVAPRSMTRAFENALRRAKLDGTLHCLRHTYCSHLVMAGVPLRVVQVLAGHANYKTTERYAHLAPEQVIDAALRVNV